MMKSFIVIDAYNFMFRSYYALPQMEDHHGNQVGAVYGFCNTLLRYLSNQELHYIAVACDSGKPSFRSSIYQEYKANRGPVPEDIKTQFPLMYNALKAFGIKSITIEGFEADDIIATLSEKYSCKEIKVIIFSSDKDLMQLIRPGIIMFDIVKNTYITAAEVEKKMGVAPELVTDYLALCGDASDNVPGVKGVGPKTASNLLKQYGSLPEILNNLESIKPVGIAQKMKKEKEKALLSHKLVTLEKNLPINLHLDDFAFHEPDKETLIDFLDYHGFKRIKARTTQLFFREETQHEWPISSREDWLESIPHTARVALIKTDDGVIAYSDQKTAALVNTVKLRDELTKEKYFLLKVGYNLKELNWDIDEYDDIMLMHYSLYTQKTSLFLLLEKELGKSVTENTNKVELAALILELHESLRRRLYTSRMISLYCRLEHPMAKIVRKIENNGVKIDKENLEQLSQKYHVIIAGLTAEIHELAGEKFNIGSPKQIAEVLFEKLCITKPDTRSNSTNYNVLEELGLNGYPIANKILEWRYYNKLVTTYTDALIKHIHPKTNRIHTCYNLGSTSTGRLSSTNPNLQNIPIKNTSDIRECFIPQKGSVLISADYSQIELRLLAYIAQIKDMQDALNDGADIHCNTASTIFGIDPCYVDNELRRKAKAINFGIIYGLTPYGLSKQLKIPIKQADAYIQEYFNKYPGIAEYMDRAKCYAHKFGYVKTIYGRRCTVENINNKSNVALRKLAERAAINIPIQGSAADVMKIALIRLDRQCKNAKIVMQVHDEFVLEVAEKDVRKIAEMMKSVMEGVLYPVLKAEIKKGRSLANMTKVL